MISIIYSRKLNLNSKYHWFNEEFEMGYFGSFLALISIVDYVLWSGKESDPETAASDFF